MSRDSGLVIIQFHNTCKVSVIVTAFWCVSGGNCIGSVICCNGDGNLFHDDDDDDLSSVLTSV